MFVAHYWDPRLALLIGLFAAISCTGALNGLILVQGELPLAMARNRAFPAWFAKTSRHGTATRSILLSSGLATLLILARAGGSVSQLFVFMILLSTARGLDPLSRLRAGGASPAAKRASCRARER